MSYRKLKLRSLKLKSFVTTLDHNEHKTVKGGYATEHTDCTCEPTTTDGGLPHYNTVNGCTG